MVLGTTSGAGKSWLATAMCRWYARQGFKVAPFKAQNMSNNARVVAGGEIGSAQYFQALAAGAAPDVRMNPLLLKPERDTHSQVILMGQVSAELSALPWRGRSEHVWPKLARALDELRADHDIVVIEGAGSPAEINLMDSDIVNLRVARHAEARCLLVTDIDRGGAFAHLYGTWALMPEADRARLAGFVLNKFRGDASLLAPAPERLQALTGVPTLATLPMWWQHGLPEEDGVFDERNTAAGEVRLTVAVVACPRISNLDEFQPLKNVAGLRLRWVRSPAELAGADWVVLPGSKNTSGDLAWMRAQGLDRAVAEHAARGGAVLGICGGLQMLGEALIDPHGVDGNGPGLGLLPLVTVFEEDKTVRLREARFGVLKGPWAALSEVAMRGYEIHHGRTAPHPAMAAAGDRAEAVMAEDLAWQNAQGNVLGLYLHGLFEDPAVLQALFGARARTLDAVFDGLADHIDSHFEAGALRSLIE
ncbi:Cobyric acid synthase [Variovorax sp. WDL1]|nr:Cobyric acid synthase [Variovorax sp. WDL1]PNG56591.1 Cobyric acid synthase [Variovorax sp. B4]PNG58015.1 Cobyric acid synthase [Variovorax sp. B2]VTV09506.1 Cobyric acid synthase [Variovorax sp. WDL1]